jgi:hypothetical protein
VPEFSLTPEQCDEWQNALAPAAQTDLFQHFAALGIDLPIDEWLAGAARVRESLQAWEQMSIQAERWAVPGRG